MTQTNSNHKIKRAVAITDICGYGKCSLGITIPVLATAGIEVCPIPTGIFDTHTAIDNYEYLPTDNFVENYPKKWSAVGFDIDSIYTGYFTEKKQIYTALQLIAEHKNAYILVDPVMGDFGKFYDKKSESLSKHIKRLCQAADLITPNLTEACILTNRSYISNPSDSEIKDILIKLKTLNAKNIVLTGVVEDNIVKNYIYDQDENMYTVKQEHNNYIIHGAGDLFSSCILAYILNDKTLKESVELSCNFVDEAIKFTVKQKGFENRGVSFEPLLKKIPESLL